MKLGIKGLSNYAMKVEVIHDRRTTLTVLELDRSNTLTGREWSVTYDPSVVGGKQLALLMDAKIRGESQVVEVETDETLEARYMSDLMGVLFPLFSTAINNAVNEMRDRMEAIARNERVLPEQVLIERLKGTAAGKLEYKLRPMIAKIVTDVDNGPLEQGNEGRLGIWNRVRGWIHAAT